MVTEGDTQNVPVLVSLISTVIINGISCPLTVLLNVLVIMAVKRRPRLQTNTNILLACLAATDVLTGLLVQPSFILCKTLQLFGVDYADTISELHDSSLCIVMVSSALHLIFVTFERLVAIKFTMHYSYILEKRNIKAAVIAFWIIAFICGLFRLTLTNLNILYAFVALVLLSCVLFITCSYVILHLETLRHQKMIKTQQTPQEEVERFAKESKALKTTVFVVGAVIFSLLPSVFFLVVTASRLQTWSPSEFLAFTSWLTTFSMTNSLLNPLIYCWRQEEMRKTVFRFPNERVHPANAN